MAASNDGQINLKAIGRANYPGERLGDTDLPGLSSIGVWDAQGRQNWGLDWHRNEGIELTFLESGTLPWALGDHEFMLKPNDLTISRPWQPHRVGLPTVQASRLHWIIVDVGVRRPNQKWGWPPWLVLTPNDIQELTTLLRQCEQPVWQATRDIKHCFGEIGQALTNTSAPIQYLNQCRVEMASQMLVNAPQRSITDIALACGFGSSQYFSTVFKRHRGCNPKALRQS